jgi:hypothetical protein
MSIAIFNKKFQTPIDALLSEFGIYLFPLQLNHYDCH